MSPSFEGAPRLDGMSKGLLFFLGPVLDYVIFCHTTCSIFYRLVTGRVALLGFWGLVLGFGGAWVNPGWRRVKLRGSWGPQRLDGMSEGLLFFLGPVLDYVIFCHTTCSIFYRLVTCRVTLLGFWGLVYIHIIIMYIIMYIIILCILLCILLSYVYIYIYIYHSIYIYILNTLKCPKHYLKRIKSPIT
jgi:hypothetical protein